MDSKRSSDLHISACDGIRGAAVLLVLFGHSNLGRGPDDVLGWLMTRGWAGVELFFVLSGFLITGILIDARGSGGFFSSFYARRLLRIFPLYYLVLLLALWALPALGLWGVRPFEGNAAWYLAYASNLGAVFADFQDHPLLRVSWSLAIEEQFYLLWPLVIALTRPRLLLRTCLALLGGSILLRAALAMGGAFSREDLYVFTFTRLDGLLIGALIAQLWRDGRLWSRTVAALPRVLGLTTVGLLLVTAYDHVANPARVYHGPAMQSVGFTFLAVLFGVLLVHCVASPPEGRVRRFFEARWLRTFGKYSYAIYLLHPFVLHATRGWFKSSALARALDFGPSGWLGQCVYAVLLTLVSLGVAWVSWHAFEKHFLSLKRFFPYGKDVGALAPQVGTSGQQARSFRA